MRVNICMYECTRILRFQEIRPQYIVILLFGVGNREVSNCMYLMRFANTNVNKNTFASGKKIVKLQASVYLRVYVRSNVLVYIRIDVSMRTTAHK